MTEEKSRIYKLEVMGAIVTVDDEGNWRVVDNPKQVDEESITVLLDDACLDLLWVPTFPPGMHYVAGAIENMDAKLLGVDPPFEYSDDPNIVY
ncbi:MAG: hypothetical protein OXL97_04275 [Chloroflexota bacterium]|nr:hypothetical protein [Chloroflexota bacterium]MDE2883927.1 hypothetical protein [Chloroflexota bacterium]